MDIKAKKDAPTPNNTPKVNNIIEEQSLSGSSNSQQGKGQQNQQKGGQQKGQQNQQKGQNQPQQQQKGQQQQQQQQQGKGQQQQKGQNQPQQNQQNQQKGGQGKGQQQQNQNQNQQKNQPKKPEPQDEIEIEDEDEEEIEEIPRQQTQKNKKGKNQGLTPQQQMQLSQLQQQLSFTPGLEDSLQSVVESQLLGLMGRTSGYVESLPPAVQRRLRALKNLQDQHAQLEANFREEVLALEAKYLGLYAPLYNRRFEITSAKAEPTEEETHRPEGSLEDELESKLKIEEEEEEEEEPKKGGKGGKGKGGKGNQQKQGAKKAVKAPEPEIKGIPEFWSTALKNHPYINEIVTENDLPALKFLDDIRLNYANDNHAYVLEFFFSPNPYFENAVLTKTYHLQNNVSPAVDDLMYTGVDGCTINWKEGKDLTVRIELKKQKNKNNKKTRVIKKEVPQESFFRFFSPPPEEEEGYDEMIEQDFEIGETFKTKIIPHAVDWFTGEALEYEDFMEDGEEYDEEDEEIDYDDEEEDDDDDDDGQIGAVRPGEKPQECNQQ